jgi:hypothetical protein
MIKYIINAQDPNQSIRDALPNLEDQSYFCRRTLEWSIQNIIKDNVFDELIVSYKGKLTKSILEEFAKTSNIRITLIPSERYFSRVVDDLLFGDDAENLDGVDLRSFINNEDKIFVAHMDGFYDKSVYLDFMRFDKPIVFGTNSYTVFRINSTYYKWIADFMVLGSVDFLRKHNIRFSWNKLTPEIKIKLFELAQTDNIFINEKHINKTDNLDGLQHGSLTLAALQFTGAVHPLDILDVGDANSRTPKTAHLKSFFSQYTSNYGTYLVNNIVLHTVMFGRIDEQRIRLQKIIDENIYKLCAPQVLSYYNSFFGQKILNDREKENFYKLLDGILLL